MKLQRISTASVLVREDTDHLRLSRVHGRPALPAFWQAVEGIRYGVRRRGKGRKDSAGDSGWAIVSGAKHMADCMEQMARLRSPTPPLKNRRTLNSFVMTLSSLPAFLH